ncbi:MAG: TlpA disulfide reductase family protein [Gemmatimonadales bacterium]|nr:TlpA disulfide reductase family protein [Gemmatimonadales bacterium]
MGRSAFAVAGTLLVLTTGVSVVLAHRLDQLSAAYREVRVLATTLHKGSVVPAFATESMTGDPIVVGETTDSSRKQVLFVFTTTCPYCKASLPAWRRVAEALGTSGGASIVGISLDSADATSAYVAEHGLRFDIVQFPSRRIKRLYRAGMVPQTVVLDFDGHVVHSRVGLLQIGPATDSVLAAVRGPPPPPAEALFPVQ